MPILGGQRRTGALQPVCRVQTSPRSPAVTGPGPQLPVCQMGATLPVRESPGDSLSVGGSSPEPVITASSHPGGGGAPTVASAQLSAPGSSENDDARLLGCSFWNWGHFRVGCCCCWLFEKQNTAHANLFTSFPFEDFISLRYWRTARVLGLHRINSALRFTGIFLSYVTN